MVDTSMMDLFRMEVEQQCHVLNEALLVLDESPTSAEHLESAMRASHSIKGAARLVDLQAIVKLAHIMEDCLVAAQEQRVILSKEAIDQLLAGMDMIQQLTEQLEDVDVWLQSNQKDYDALLTSFETICHNLQDNDEDNTTEATPVQEREKEKDVAVEKLDIQDMSMFELFRVEAEQQAGLLSSGLLELEQDPTSQERLEPLMRAAHSIKGAAKLIGVQVAVELAHTIEDVFVSAQNSELVLEAEHIDVLLKGVDMIMDIAKCDQDLSLWYEASRSAFDALMDELQAVLNGNYQPPAEPAPEPVSQPANSARDSREVKSREEMTAEASVEGVVVVKEQSRSVPQRERVLRVTADQLNRLMGLAGESLVESRWIYPYAGTLLRLKRQQTDLVCVIDSLRDRLDNLHASEELISLVRDAQHQASQCREMMADRLTELEAYERRATNLSSRLHREVVQSRMRPFGDGVHGFPRMVRDIARSLKKDVQLQIDGEATLVDRDIFDKIEAPLNHLIRNGIDHGMETPDERKQIGKPEKGTIRLSAYHHSGMLSIVVEDDGRGVDIERIRSKVVEKGLVDDVMAETLSESELLDFLFLPSFSTKEQVSEISGRGVGLDVVHDVVHGMRGNVRATTKLGEGTRFHLQLPLTLSVIPALIVEIAGEPYAFPLARIDRILRVTPAELDEAEGHQYVRIDGRNVGLVNAGQILEKPSSHEGYQQLHLVVLSERQNHYGMVVDRFMGERDLVVQVMPRSLGVVKDISAAALMEDGSPVLIIDVDDLIRSTEKVLKVAKLDRINSVVDEIHEKKSVLVVDDSLTVREVERNLLEAAGYLVETAVDGIDGLNVLRSGEFDMVITDVDMPRMNGIDLVRNIRQDPILRTLPILMVSYKDREEDKIRGMEAGADYYLTKGSFHDESLRKAVMDLIGDA